MWLEVTRHLDCPGPLVVPLQINDDVGRCRRSVYRPVLRPTGSLSVTCTDQPIADTRKPLLDWKI